MAGRKTTNTGCEPGPQVIEGRGLWHGRMLLFSALSSTNRWAMENLGTCGHGDVVRAIRQTSGTGRFGRPWLVPADRGLALTVILKDCNGRPPVALAGQVAAVAVADCLGCFGLAGSLKWPNDVMVADLKISGILAERDAGSGAIVVGVGLNVNVTRADLKRAGLAGAATSMRIANGRRQDIDHVLARFLVAFMDRLDEACAGCLDLAAQWARRDWLAGSAVEVTGAGAVVDGRYNGIDSEGRLHLVGADGKDAAIWSGDVEKVRRGRLRKILV